MSSVGYHEPIEELSAETRDMHRAITSLMEELEAVDWYNQRADACKDPELKAILQHNRDEEKEHACAPSRVGKKTLPTLHGSNSQGHQNLGITDNHFFLYAMPRIYLDVHINQTDSVQNINITLY